MRVRSTSAICCHLRSLWFSSPRSFVIMLL
nr:MAG TPA: hypothetical protein [Caudoviricetes sp.]